MRAERVDPPYVFMLLAWAWALDFVLDADVVNGLGVDGRIAQRGNEELVDEAFPVLFVVLRGREGGRHKVR